MYEYNDTQQPRAEKRHRKREREEVWLSPEYCRSFSTYGNPSGKCLCVYVCVLGADFIASTNLSPNFIKAKNGIFVTSTVCLQWR